jgi:hypothetical protein
VNERGSTRRDTPPRSEVSEGQEQQIPDWRDGKRHAGSSLQTETSLANAPRTHNDQSLRYVRRGRIKWHVATVVYMKII